MIRLERLRSGIIQVLNITTHAVALYMETGGRIEGTVIVSHRLIRDFVRSGERRKTISS